MSLRSLPEVKAFDRPDGLSWDAPSDALARWSGGPMAAEADDPSTISLYDVIGEDAWTGGGWTAKRMAGALRAIGKKDVTVNVNSPGGDFFEGLAIFNLLREHPAKVTVKVMGYAASAASVIAMAGDEIRMGAGSFLMIHNAWAVAIGNRHDMRAAADVLEPFDAAMADIYAARTGQKREDVAAMMDAETWLGAGDAVAKGFADVVEDMPEPAVSASLRPEIAARRRIDALLAKQGVPRSERRAMLREASGTHDAAGTATPRAGLLTASLADLLITIKP
ncbi:head maturation protease, ClpP-related [Azospirillum thermophilum]|uniref:ATP-dependent Clp protease proteolytic subunit n=1 Tax=Azospirillum thermophilum TaxID=2202148 RepID=A0A2S2CL49_9PROT|nr:head maturation protease, ClpP-related [Azospirillum thermophilum]AWK85037.1 peptidase [Azospirillum thermophilum]